MHLVSPRSIGTNRHEIIQVSPFQNHQGRHNFREAGGGHSLSSVVFIQHTPTIEFLEKNAMGWSHTPQGKLVGDDRRSDLNRTICYVLCIGEGWSEDRGTEQ